VFVTFKITAAVASLIVAYNLARFEFVKVSDQ